MGIPNMGLMAVAHPRHLRRTRPIIILTPTIIILTLIITIIVVILHHRASIHHTTHPTLIIAIQEAGDILPAPMPSLQAIIITSIHQKLL